jgi:hypothetical protein
MSSAASILRPPEIDPFALAKPDPHRREDLIEISEKAIAYVDAPHDP